MVCKNNTSIRCILKLRVLSVQSKYQNKFDQDICKSLQHVQSLSSADCIVPLAHLIGHFGLLSLCGGSTSYLVVLHLVVA